MSKILMIFVDGVGIGKKDPESNIFFKRKFNFLEKIFGSTPHLEHQFISKENKYIFPVDATLGVDDLPQSGTGQTSIFCGFNAPQRLGFHFGPYPYSTLVPLIEKENIFKEFKEKGKKVSFANAYPKVFFDYIDSGKRRLSVTSLSCLLSDVRLNRVDDLRAGKALSAEIDNSRWVKKLDYDLPIISPGLAAKRLINLALDNDFTLFEYFYTDHIGHSRIKDIADYLLNVFDDFMTYILTHLPEDLTLLICSDHGNIEDTSIKMHTTNPTLTISEGKHAKDLSEKIKDISQIKRALLDITN